MKKKNHAVGRFAALTALAALLALAGTAGVGLEEGARP